MYGQQQNEAAAQNAYLRVGYLYRRQRAYRKALEYFEKYQNACAGGRESPMVWEVMGDTRALLKQTGAALTAYETALKNLAPAGQAQSKARLKEKIATQHLVANQTEQAIFVYQQIAESAETGQDFLAASRARNNIGYLYNQFKNRQQALTSFRLALKLAQQAQQAKNQPPAQLVEVQQNLGFTYSNLREFGLAETHYKTALKIAEQHQLAQAQAETYNFLGANAFLQKDTETAISHLQKAIELAKPLVNQPAAQATLAESYEIMARLSAERGDAIQARSFDQEADQIKEKLAEAARVQEQELINAQAEAEQMENQARLALADRENQAMALQQIKLQAANREQELALLKREDEIKQKDLERQLLEKKQAQQALALTQQQLQAEKGERLIIELERSQKNQSLALATQQLKAQVESRRAEKLEAEKIVKEQQLALQTNELTAQRAQRQVGILAIGLLTLLAGAIALGFVLKRRSAQKLERQAQKIQLMNEELKTREHELKQNLEEMTAIQEQMRLQRDDLFHKNKNLNDSIHYAKRIQDALLPRAEDLKASFPASFVMFKPRDIISGDFYWFTDRGNHKIVAAIDCTGHGVPGAFMSMIGTALLNQIVIDERVYYPDKILQKMDLAVRQALAQEGRSVADGMDAAICYINMAQKKLYYAGAMNPLYYARPDGALTEIRADRKPIGGSLRYGENERTFITHEIDLSEPLTFYLCSDGLQDQIGGPDNRRFQTSRLKQLLGQLCQLPIDQQQAQVEQTLAQWMQTHPQQLDDILLLGVQTGGNT